VPAAPGVSVVVPVLNEERHLAEAVGRLLSQDYEGPLEVVLALGPSEDRTDEVAAELAARDPRVRLVANPTGRTPTGLNAAIREASHEVVVRCDAHAMVPGDYVALAVDALERTGAVNVGGIMAAEGETPFEDAVACAMTSRLGVGSASFHVGGEEGPALTVYLGAFRRSAIEDVGGYDESMLRAQDWEMNHRLRERGGRGLPSRRHLRPLRRGALARQYRDYGRWRREVARRYPSTISLRYLAAPTMLVGVTLGTAVGVAALLGAPGWLGLGWLAPGGYLALVSAGALTVGRGLRGPAKKWLVPVLVTMHVAWGWGFLSSPRDLRAS
jgi:succinoglycan biosynthesis protein ExoA